MATCFLLNTDTNEEFELQAIKESSSSYEVNYATIETLQTAGFAVEWQNTSGIQRSFTVGLNSRLLTGTVAEAYAQFRTFAAGNVVLAFQWGDEDIFSPCLINGRITYTENEYDNTGKCSAATLTFSLLQIPDSIVVEAA